MDLRVGGKIKFDDGEGAIYEAVITEFNRPYSFVFREVNDLLEMRIDVVDEGCTLNFVIRLMIEKWRYI
ncbi:SRPBCC family protein [Litchfieldia alkalitelluris]|uniref:hypothetical protein n=1 Tax=Litchfieldia alkalitelluris TaxID=304268 RepID=UPI001F452C22|nr:hypothetical protein [Litchfieldia alkalitelluris]